jgi:outer membrane receptor protein involved in Fe transport
MSISIGSRALWGGASVLAILLAGTTGSQAFAQQKVEATAVDEVVVTATGREARIQDVPIPITAVTAEGIKNADITDLKTLGNVVPSYKLAAGQSNAAGATAFIRGIGTGGDNAGFESAVGFFIDGVYRNRAGVALSELPEVERVEVLRGPQGTLFGRNTSAGAISVTTKGPEFTTRGFLNLTAGNLNERKAVFAVTGPLSGDVLAGRVEGNYQKRDGYITDVNSGRKINDRNRYSLRGQLLWNINDDATFRFIADTSHTDEECCAAVYSKIGSLATAINTVAGLRGLVGIPPINPKARQTAVTPGRNYLEQVDEWGVSGELNWNINDLRLSSITSYRNWELLRNQDVDFSGQDRAYRDGYTDEFKTFTQELRLNGEAGKVNWLIGGFYANEKLPHTDKIRVGIDGQRYVDALAAGALPGYNVFGSLGTTGCGAASALYTNCRLLAASIAPPGSPAPLLAAANAYANAIAAAAPTAGQGQVADNFETKTESVSLFTHNVIQLTDKLSLTAGLRYNHEKKDLTANLNSQYPVCGVLTANPTFSALTAALVANPASAGLITLVCNPVLNTIANGTYDTSSSENEWSGTTSLSYKPNDDVMIYGGYSRGYKAGGYNLDRSGFQILPSTTVKPSATELHFDPEFTDAYEAGVKSTLLGGSTTLNAAVFYEKISDFQSNNFSGFNFVTRNVPKVVSQGVEVDLVTRPTSDLTLQLGGLYNDAKYKSSVVFGPGYGITAGTRLAGASKWTLTGAATYKRPVTSTINGLVYVDARYVSKYATQTLNPDPSGSTDQSGYVIVNGRIGFSPEDGSGWGLDLYVRNLFDKYYNVGGFGVPEQTGNFAVYPSEPRTYGATVKLSF